MKPAFLPARRAISRNSADGTFSSNIPASKAHHLYGYDFNQLWTCSGLRINSLAQFASEIDDAPSRFPRGHGENEGYSVSYSAPGGMLTSARDSTLPTL